MSVAEAVRRVLRGQKASALRLPVAVPTQITYNVDTILGMDVAQMWRTQPYLRTVVQFMARNVAQLGLHAFRRVDDTDRQRLHDHPLALLVARPNTTTTCYELVYQLVADLALYDDAYWLLGADADAPAGYTLTRIPPSWIIGTEGGDMFAPGAYVVSPNTGVRAGQVTISASQIMRFHGWDPDDPRSGCSPVNALKQILAEQIEAQAYRTQVWKRGGRTSSVLSRPADAPPWTPEARARFRDEWRSQYTGNGPQAGGTPVLEDGMTLNKAGFSAHEDEFVDVAKLALTVVASVYNVNPTMIGLLDNANYSNVREFRRMLYGDTLGPVLSQIEDRLNTFLVTQLPDPDGVYVEFNIAEKLQGSFEEQAAVMSTSVGRPWMTADEARGRFNMPAMGGDAEQLVTPLNVIVGGQASPRDSAPPPIPAAASRALTVKARASQTHVTKAEQVLRDLFGRQYRAVASRLGAGATTLDDLWDAERWDRELAGDLFKLYALISTEAGRATMRRVGIDPDTFDSDRTLHYLRAAAEGNAAAINTTTRNNLADAVQAEQPADATRSLFDRYQNSRAEQIAVTTTTAVSGFGTVEAVRHTGRQAAKTWRVVSSNPRPSHAAMNGESVAYDDVFSNGARWPGDSVLDDDERANCTCELDVSLE